ncbi:MAG: TauD/TfdA dioxygenase family protein [Gammaproteobacteria bacterium]
MPYEYFAKREDPEFNGFSVAPVSGALGAFISDIDITESINEDTAQELRDALVHYMVLFFRDQPLQPAAHVRFAEVFGEVQMGGTIPRLEEQPEIKKQEYTSQSQVSGDVNMHADDTFVEMPSRCSILHGVKMPQAGGDTIWVNCEAAYDALSDPMKQLLEPLEAEHNLSAKFGNVAPGVEDPEMKVKIYNHYPPVTHPVIRSHPVSGRKCIYVNEMVTSRIIGLEPDESDVILNYLIDHLKKPIFQCRLHWEDDTVVVWDNRATQHQVLADFQPSYRLNQRIAIKDDVRPQH